MENSKQPGFFSQITDYIKKWIIQNIWNPILIAEIVSFLVFLLASISHIGYTFQQGENSSSIFSIYLGKAIGVGVETMLVILAFQIVVKKSRKLFALIKEYRLTKGKPSTKKGGQKKTPELFIATDNKVGLLWGGMSFFAFMNFYGNFYYYLAILKENLVSQNITFPETGYPTGIITLSDITFIDPFVLFTRVFIFAFFMPFVSLLMVEIIKFTVEQKALKDLERLMKEDEDEKKSKRENKESSIEKESLTIKNIAKKRIKPVEQKEDEESISLSSESKQTSSIEQPVKTVRRIPSKVEQKQEQENGIMIDAFDNQNTLTIPKKEV